MPLFGSHKHHNEKEAARADKHAVRTGAMAPAAGTGTGTGAMGATGATNYDNTAMGTGRHHAPMTGVGAGNAGQPGFNEPGYGGNFEQGRHGYNNTMAANDPYGAAGVGHGNNNLPPVGAINDSNQSRGGTGSRMTGKVEHAVGSLLGSNALKAKGLQKEQEANAIKIQGQELAEAERLEREAMLRRERAVGHGAHPDNKHLGAGLTNPGGNQTGSGPYN